MPTTTRIILGGDVMLGRMVKEAIQSNGIDYPMGPIAVLMQRGDLTIVNLECAITTNSQVWQGAPKAFYFGAPPTAAQILTKCGVDLVSLANNHILDYEVKGLIDTLHYLKQENIRYAGAGANKAEALTPAYLQINNRKFGMAAFCDHQADFTAQKNTPGMAYLNLEDEKSALQQIQLSLSQMEQAQVDWPILSLHWGPNMVSRPSKQFIHIAHAAIDMGYKMLFGHSAHIFHGIEIYKGYPIIYAAGDLVDDYYVDPEFRNDHQLLFEVELSDLALKSIKLYPVFIGLCQTKRASKTQFDFIAERMQNLCREMGTSVQQVNQEFLVIYPH